MADVSFFRCPDYSEDSVRLALTGVLSPLGGLDWVTPGMKIVIKANLVTFLNPSHATTTHPALLCELTRQLVARGATVIVGDSPGGLYSAAFVNRVYSATGMRAVEKYGGQLNSDFGQSEAVFPDGRAAKSFTYTSYLDSADAIINFCKLKSHGMMGMSCAVKNMFGAIPGTMKPEYHYRFPEHSDFADMIIDINEYFRSKIKLCICDAVVGMEGNGPTAGAPRHVGVLLASASPYALDLVAADLIGLGTQNVPTLQAAYRRGLASESANEVHVTGDTVINDLRIPDFKNIATNSSIDFKGDLSGGIAGKVVGELLGKLLRSKPTPLKNECVGCGICANLCPPHAIEICNGIARIDRKKCISCFCCQEFCPKGAMKVKRTAIARLCVHETKKA